MGGWQAFALMLANHPFFTEEREMVKSQPQARGDKKQDKQMVKSGVHQHESNMHKGKPKTKLKLGK